MPADFLAFRKRLGLTQAGSAALFAVDARTWQNWEAGKPVPGPARVLVAMLTRRPELVADIQVDRSPG